MADPFIVDDDPDSLEALAEVIRIAGHEVRSAYNGEEGLRRLAERQPDLILLDVQMPVLSGPEMAYRMLVHNVGQEEAGQSLRTTGPATSATVLNLHRAILLYPQRSPDLEVDAPHWAA
jgi:CheY-like chemotaxis protein